MLLAYIPRFGFGLAGEPLELHGEQVAAGPGLAGGLQGGGAFHDVDRLASLSIAVALQQALRDEFLHGIIGLNVRGINGDSAIGVGDKIWRGDILDDLVGVRLLLLLSWICSCWYLN